ncbi:MAG TPA: [FeFe] hydrogenase H-cluster radical SAM maturase HydE [Phycisphaerae bacterium]|nr:[FeFe] hydrogenase H-cluster radical SAM maturase HydE [Phycisphaerae bacterium]
MNRNETAQWLREGDEHRLEELWQRADAQRRRYVGDEVYLRGLIEFSNYCARLCCYCGLRAENPRLRRYRMTADEIMACARQAVEFGYGTVVLQSGEDHGMSVTWMVELIRRIKAETPLAVTLSLGERGEDELLAWRKAGADRYLLRFETSNEELYQRIHPPLIGRPADRIGILRMLRRLGYEVGSGVMIGIPGQTYEDLANDLELFRELDLDMIGVGPFLPHPETPLGRGDELIAAPEGEQAPNSELMTYKMVALTRLVCPRANIPSTTALATLNRENGRELGLCRGANIIMPNLTPAAYRCLYEVYPAKACLFETAEACHGCIQRRILDLGRKIGAGRGDSPNRLEREEASDEATARNYKLT